MGSKKCFLYFYTTKQKALTLSNNFPLKFWRLYLESCLLHLGHKNISKISKSSWKRKFCLFSTNFCFIDTLCPTYKHNKTGFFFFSEFFLRSIRPKDLLQIVVPDTQIVKIDFICTYHQRYSDVFLENMNGALVWYGKMIANDIFYIPKLNFNPMLNHLFSVLNRHCNNDTQYFIELSRLEIFEHMIAVRDFK